MSSIKNVLIVFGTRPEAIKMAPLVKKFENEHTMNVQVCVTAQHRRMLDQVLSVFNLKPKYDLDIMAPNQSLIELTSKITLALQGVFRDFKPDIVLVHGDTTTTFATSLAAYYSGIVVGHVEAGLRTFNINNPWPEEGNRQLTGVLAKYHFAPTAISKENLLKESKPLSSIIVTGNTVIDSLLWVINQIESRSAFRNKITAEIAKKYKITNNRIILVTGHRRENFGKGFISICKALKQIALNNPTVDIVYPVHLNPNVQTPVQNLLSSMDNIYLISPLKYEEFIYLMSKSYFIITDSGGIQEEAPSLGKPVLLMRETTERPEAVDAGIVKLVGTNPKHIVNNAQLLLDSCEAYQAMSKAHNPYGSGDASQIIVDFIKNEQLK